MKINTSKRLAIDEVRSLWSCDPKIGDVFWRKRGMGRHRNRPAGTLMGSGYRKIGMRRDGIFVQFYAHQIVWALHYGEWPEIPIDHINGDKGDNRICNLRAASYGQNAVNKGISIKNSSGLKWVSKRKNRNSWQAAVWFGKDRKQAYFSSKERAFEWASDVARNLHGDFYNPG